MAIFGTDIVNLPAASSLTGTEIIPVVQDGITSRSTISAIAASAALTPEFLVLSATTDLANERVFAVSGSGLTASDGGAGNNYTVSLAGTVKSLQDNSATGIIAKDTTSTVVTRTMQQPSEGFTITNPGGVGGDPTFALSHSLASLQNLAGVGGIYRVGTDTLTLRTLAGTSNQIDVTNGDGVSGAPTISISSNPIIPGTGSIGLPKGTTGERSGATGAIRWNTTLSQFEGYNGSSWIALDSSNAAPKDAEYVVLSLDSTLTDERVLAVDSTLSLTDGGAGGDVTLAVEDNTSTQKIEIVKNSGAVVGTRKQLNFIEGGNISLTISDDVGNDQVDITIDTVAAGTVTSVAISGSSGIGVSGSPITSSGTITLSLGAITPTSVAASGTVTGSNLSGTNTGDQTLTSLGVSAYMQTLLDDADAATARTNLGLGTIATQNASSVAITGGAVDNATIGGTTRAAAAFTNIGIGGAASSSNKLLVSDVIADPSGQIISSNFTNSTSYTANNAQQTYGHFVTSTLTQGAFNGTNSTASLIAFRALAQTASGTSNTGTITGLIGAIYGANNNGSGTLTTSTAILVNSALNSGAGAITNVYGLVISDQTVGSTLNVGARFRVSSGTGKYNIYADGTAQNFMQGVTNVDNNIVVGSGALSTSATDKFIYGATCAGTPSGTPTTFTGRSPSIYDSTNNKWYKYNSGWKFVGSPTSCFEMQLSGSLSAATYIMHTKARFSFTINGIYGLKHTSGTSTLAVKINGTSVTGLSAISVTSTAQDVTASGANTVAAGDQITFVLSSVSSPVDIFSTLDITRT